MKDETNDPRPVSRRQFVSGSLFAGGGYLFGGEFLRGGDAPTMKAGDLRKKCRGDVATPGSAEFEKLAQDGLWNRLIPDRRPAVIVKAADEADVITAIQFARENRLKVAVRGGGHNWCQPSLRQGGMLIDLGNFNRIISIDAAERRAVVQPVVSNREIMQQLHPLGLGFPVGHCPDVKLSGYLLGGGIAWNMGGWGSGAGSVESVELVTANAELVTASPKENSELFWAALGSGYGFFGVVTKYHLRLHPLPSAIFGSVYFYPLEQAPTIAKWLGGLAPELPSRVELTMLLAPAPPKLRDAAAANGGRVCVVPVTSFANSEKDALADLRRFEECPVRSSALSFTPPEVQTFEDLFDASLQTWLPGMRCKVDAAYSEADPEKLIQPLVSALQTAPSPFTFALLGIPTGPKPQAPQPEPAYSMGGRCYWGPWSQWKDASEDAANLEWHKDLVRELRPFVSGFYIGETDAVAFPAAAAASFSPRNWKHLADLRDKFDPEGLFFGYFDHFLSGTE